MKFSFSLDIMFMNKFASVMSISNKLKFIIANSIATICKYGVLAVMEKVMDIYSHRRLHITECNSENEFEPL